jgi:4-amino-4-deoxy-L-arabinose transferase-like glycosyltransferase
MKRLSSLLLILVVVISIGLQLWAASRQSYWEDEAFTAQVASRGPAEVAKVVDWDVHPPLYLYLAAYWGLIYGYQELGLRFLSILCSEFALFLTYLLATDLLGKKTGLCAVILLAFSPLFLMFGHNARYYALSAVFALLQVYSMWLYLKSRRIRYLLLYVASSILFLYLLFAALVVLAACNLWYLWGWRRKENRFGWSLLFWGLAQVLVLAAYYPGFQSLLTVAQRTAEVASVSNWLVEAIKRFIYTGYVFGLGETLSPLNPLAWVGAIILIGIGLIAIKSRRREHDFWLPVFLVFIVVLSGLLVSVNASVSLTWQNLPVRAFYVLPFLAIWLGAGLAALQPRWMAIAGALLAVVYGAGIYNYFSGTQYLRPIFSVPWRTVFQDIQAQAQPGALVVCGPGDSACGYYSDLFGYGNPSVSPLTDGSGNKAPEVWWIEIYLSRISEGKEHEQAILDQLGKDYGAVSTHGYGKQDPSIRQLKSRFLGQDNYEYRVLVYRFYNP